VPSSVLSFFQRIVVCCACALVLAFSATSAMAAPLDTPIPQPSPGAELANFAEQYVGSPYRWGGASPSGFDCTGFVMWVYSQFGVAMPHNEAGQLASGERVGADDLQPGDVLIFANTYRAGLSHAGIYLGDGQFVHAVDERHGVMVSALWDNYWGPRLVGASRAMS
jgi:cell wall-associated NlpC family hydrolase